MIVERRIIDTEHLRLAPIGPSLAEGIWMATKASLPELRRWMWWANAVTPETTREFAQEAEQQWETGTAYAFAVLEGNAVVGTTGVDVRGSEARVGEIGYWIRSDRAGRGYATEAAGAVVDHSFAVLGLYRLELRAGVQNLASQRVAEKLGFRREGVLRQGCPHGDAGYDCYLYGLLAMDPRP